MILLPMLALGRPPVEETLHFAYAWMGVGSILNGANVLALSAGQVDPYGMWSADLPSRLTVQKAGNYRCGLMYQITSVVGNISGQVRLNGSTNLFSTAVEPGQNNIGRSVSGTVDLNVGDYLELQITAADGGTVPAGASENSPCLWLYETGHETVSARVSRATDVIVTPGLPPFPWDQVDYDDGGFFDPANPGRLTAPSDGFYYVEYFISNNHAQQSGGLATRIGTLQPATPIRSWTNNTTALKTFNGYGVFQLRAGEWVELRIHEQGDNNNVRVLAGTYMTIQRVGAL